MARPLTRPDRIAARAEPALAAALARAQEALARPGEDLTHADVVRLLLWEALRARGLHNADEATAA